MEETFRCLKLERMKWRKKSAVNVENCLLFSELRKMGCPTQSSMQKATRNFCAFDSTKTRFQVTNSKSLRVTPRLEGSGQLKEKGWLIGKPLITNDRNIVQLQRIRKDNRWVSEFLKSSEARSAQKKEKFDLQLKTIYDSHLELSRKFKVDKMSREQLLSLMERVKQGFGGLWRKQSASLAPQAMASQSGFKLSVDRGRKETVDSKPPRKLGALITPQNASKKIDLLLKETEGLRNLFDSQQKRLINTKQFPLLIQDLKTAQNFNNSCYIFDLKENVDKPEYAFKNYLKFNS